MKRVCDILFVLTGFFAAAIVTAALAGLPPSKVVSKAKAMVKSAPVKTIVLTWNYPTNIVYTIQGSTNLTDWFLVTNVPAWTTNVSVTATNPYEVFRIGT